MSLNPHQHAKLAVLKSVSSAMDKMMSGKMSKKPSAVEVDVAGGEVPHHAEPHSSALDMTGEDMAPHMENSLNPKHTTDLGDLHDLHAKKDPSMSHDPSASGHDDEEDLAKLRDLYSKIK